MSFHLITHAICVAVIATLVRKYLYVSYQLDELQIMYESCINHIEGKSVHMSNQNVAANSDYDKAVDSNLGDEKTVVHNVAVNFDVTSEMQYFDDYLGTSSQDNGNDYGTIDDFTGTGNQLTESTQTDGNKVSSSKSNNIHPSTAKVSQYYQKSVSAYEPLLERSSYGSVEPKTENMYTSVWCQGSTAADRICHFHNLCYHTVFKDFIYFKSKDSVEENLPLRSDSQHILDMTSVANHNLHYFSFIKLPNETLRNFTAQWIDTSSLIFNRFKPDNIMHVLHDDILPLYQTLKQITFNENTKLSDDSKFETIQNRFDIQLVAMEEGMDEIEDFDILYSILSKYKLLTKQSFTKGTVLVCFKDAFVGISKSTTWYQYGFYKPQGPLSNILVNSHHIHDTVKYILSQIDNECPLCSTGKYLVLFSRKETRLILNEMELSIAIAQNVGMKVMSVSFETHSLEDIINIVHHSKGVIGVHGSLLAMAAFLQPGSVLIELFPFAINPAHYTPYKTLAHMPGVNIAYEVWANQNEENTKMHPDWSSELGGIYHLTNQQEIMNQKEVPHHLCCDDPSWLFHIYQDTIVDIPVVIKLIQSALSKHNVKSPIVKQMQNLTPGPVRKLKCVLGKMSAEVSWQAPWSVKYVNHKTISYELWFHNFQSNTTASFILTNVTSHTVPSILLNVSYVVWVRCKLDNILGFYSESATCYV